MKEMIRKYVSIAGIGILCVFLFAQSSPAHFQVLIPSTDIVTAEGDRTADFTVVFTHPMECGPVMNMELPEQFGVMIMGHKKDLKETLHNLRTWMEKKNVSLLVYIQTTRRSRLFS